MTQFKAQHQMDVAALEQSLSHTSISNNNNNDDDDNRHRSVLEQRGKTQILVLLFLFRFSFALPTHHNQQKDAYRDGSSVICPYCHGLIAAVRFEKHVGLWCDANPTRTNNNNNNDDDDDD